MNSALRYLLVRSFCNNVAVRLRRLRQPKYLLGAILGGAYFYFYFYRFLFGGGVIGPRQMAGAPTITPAAWPVAGAVLLLLATLLLAWILPASRAALTFTEAEIAFLFPAPISRRVLVLHKLLRSQLAFLFIAAIVTFLTGRFRAGSEAWFRLGGWWIILNTLSLHRIGASFALQRLRERGMADRKRRFAVLLALGALALLVESIRRSVPPLPALLVAPGHTEADVSGLMVRIAASGPLPYLLAPFRWTMAPYFAHDLPAFLAALGPALGIMLLHFVWVLRADISFEEASITASQKRSATMAAHRRGEGRFRSVKARTPVWRLGATGFAPLAFLWRGLIKFGGRRALACWALFFVTLGCGACLIHGYAGTKLPGWVATIAVLVGIGCYATILLSFVTVGQAATAQLRQGMAAMDLLKTFPIPGWQLALGELTAPVVLGTLLQWGALAIGGVLAASVSHGGETIIAVSAAGLAVLLPAFNLSMSILPCGAALMFPGWFKPPDGGGQGLENTGLRLIVGVAQLAALAVALLPAAFFGACAWFLMRHAGGTLIGQAIAAGSLGGFVLAMEAGLGIAWLGSLYDGYDGTGT